MSELKKHLVVVYHDGCIDGLASAWTLHQKWGQDEKAEITYIPYAHHKTADSQNNILSALTPESELYFVDVAPEKEFLNDLLSPTVPAKQKVAAVHVLDHHVTTAKNLAGYHPPVVNGFTPPPLDVVINENRPSASRMVWETLLPDQPAPPFLEMIDKMDRGENLISAEDFSAAALIDSKRILSLTDAFNACSALSRLSREQMAEAGNNILSDQEVRINKLAANVMYAHLEILPDSPPVLVPIVNANVQSFGRAITNFLNDLGKKSGAGIACAWHVQGNGAVTMSIRSEGTPDASLVAAHFCQKMGIMGGGHTTSAAVHFPSLEKFCEQVALQPAKKAPPVTQSSKKQSGQKF